MFVGRQRELAEIERALAAAEAGAGAIFLVSGEPGIGKTRLATEAAAVARERGFSVSWGRCWEAGGAPALWPWQEAFEGIGSDFPSAKMIAESDPAKARFALYREVVAALKRDAARAPLLLVLEDLHAADRSSLLVLEFVAAQLQAVPAVVIGTYRDLEVTLRPDAATALGRAGRSGRVLALPRLREAEVALLVRDAIEDADDALVSSVFETTHGNALFVDEIVRDARARGGRSDTIPLGVREIIRQRLELAPPDARPALETASVLGVEFGAQELVRMIPDAVRLLSALAEQGFVTTRGERIRFSHALYREALYHELPRARREELHREAARALGATGAPLAEIAHHLLESGADQAAEAIDHAIRAAGLAIDVFAFEDAALLLERARGAIRQGPLEKALRCRVLIATGQLVIKSGDPKGREACLEAAKIARELGDTTLLTLAGLGYGSVFSVGSVDPVLVALLEEALEGPGLAQDSALRARAMARLAAARQPSHPSKRARDVDLCFAAIELGRRVAEPRELLELLQSATGTLYGAVEPRLRLPIAREYEHLAEIHGDAARMLHARVRLAMDHLELADFKGYAAVADSYEELANRIGRAAAPWRVPLMRSMIALARDGYEESARFIEEACRIESEDPRARRAQALHRICHLRAMERHAELRAALPELRGLWMQMPYGVVLAEPRIASLLMRIGADDEVSAITERLDDDAFVEQISSPSLGEALWATRNARQAAILRQVLEPSRERWYAYWLDVEACEAPASRLLAYLAAILGDFESAERDFASALNQVEAVGKRSMAARMRFELGDLYVRSGHDPKRADALLREARRGADSQGLSELVSMIDRRHPSVAAPDRQNPKTRREFGMALEGEYFALAGSDGTLRFKASRGMQYLARLIAAPGVEIHVLDLAGSSEGVDRGDAGELVDAQAFREYRARLEALKDAAESADDVGNRARAEELRGEMERIAAEIGKVSARGGSARRGESAVDRARSAVQRRIKDAIDRIEERDPALGHDLRRAVRTGNYCSFRPER